MPAASSPSGPADDRTLFRPEDQRELKCTIRVVIEILADQPGEDWRFDEVQVGVYAIGV
jgi:hypothetical protein